MKSIKYVDYQKSSQHGKHTLHPIVTIRVRGYNKMLNPPRARVSTVAGEPLKLGF